MTAHPDSPDDRRLVADYLRTRGEAQFLRLYDRHNPAMYRFAARLAGRSGNEAAEIVQESWMRALSGLAAFRGESSLGTWLCGIVLNRWREANRKESRDVRRLALVPTPGPGRTPESSPRLAAALDDLADGYREILILHDVEGYTHEEIAARFGIALGTSKSQLHRARRALRARLSDRREAGHDR
jgi:RNA polymerase sigma-70 factor (ECF subfamily)